MSGQKKNSQSFDDFIDDAPRNSTGALQRLINAVVPNFGQSMMPSMQQYYPGQQASNQGGMMMPYYGYGQTAGQQAKPDTMMPQQQQGMMTTMMGQYQHPGQTMAGPLATVPKPPSSKQEGDYVSRQEFDKFKKELGNTQDRLFDYLKDHEEANDEFMKNQGFVPSKSIRMLPDSNPFRIKEGTAAIKNGPEETEAFKDIVTALTKSGASLEQARKKARSILASDEDDEPHAKKTKKAAKSVLDKDTVLQQMKLYQENHHSILDELEAKAGQSDLTATNKINARAKRDILENKKTYGYIYWAPNPYTRATKSDLKAFKEFKKELGLPTSSKWDGSMSDSDSDSN